MLQERELNNLIYNVEGYKRGMVAWVDLDGSNSVQRGIRPALIIQNDIGNKHSPTLIVAPLTTRKKRDMPTHLIMLKEKYKFLKSDSIVLLEQIVTVGKEKVGDYIGRLDTKDIVKLNTAISISLGLIEPQRNIIDIDTLKIIKSKVSAIKICDIMLSKCRDKEKNIDFVNDITQEKQDHIANLQRICLLNGLNMENYYEIKAVGAGNNEFRGVCSM
jgi:mRNA interferase MazF